MSRKRFLIFLLMGLFALGLGSVELLFDLSSSLRLSWTAVIGGALSLVLVLRRRARWVRQQESARVRGDVL